MIGALNQLAMGPLKGEVTGGFNPKWCTGLAMGLSVLAKQKGTGITNSAAFLNLFSDVSLDTEQWALIM